MNKKWIVKEKSETEIKNSAIIREKYHLSRIVANILAKKNITKEEEIERIRKQRRNRCIFKSNKKQLWKSV